MIIIPAIDILDGKCVRLRKGEYNTAQKVADDAVETALMFKQAGAEYLHLVDLNGAVSGYKTNAELMLEIIRNVKIPVEIGGGIRNLDTVGFYLDNGAERVILGSAAMRSPEFVKEACKLYPEKIAVGIDAKNGNVAVDGWTNTTQTDAIDFAKCMEQAGVSCIIYTEIERDGMLCGINGNIYQHLYDTVSVKITASGGIRDINDIKLLAKIGIYGSICGKSIYEGTLNLSDTIEAVKNKEEER